MTGRRFRQVLVSLFRDVDSIRSDDKSRHRPADYRRRAGHAHLHASSDVRSPFISHEAPKQDRSRLAGGHTTSTDDERATGRARGRDVVVAVELMSPETESIW